MTLKPITFDVLQIQKTADPLATEALQIIDRALEKGYKSLTQMPNDDDKKRLRQLTAEMGYPVKF